MATVSPETIDAAGIPGGLWFGDMNPRKATFLFGLLVAAGCFWTSTAGGEAPAGSSLLAGIRDGEWEVRTRGVSIAQRLCVKNGYALIQLRHPGKICERIVLERTRDSVLVQYTCKGSGFGRTRMRRETPQLVQLETQGVADGFPFDYAAEGRWVGECPRSPG